MTLRINPTSVMVDDQRKALEFYTNVLGFVKKTEIPMGEVSWLTVLSPNAPDGVELVLEPDSHPAARPFRSALVEDGRRRKPIERGSRCISPAGRGRPGRPLSPVAPPFAPPGRREFAPRADGVVRVRLPTPAHHRQTSITARSRSAPPALPAPSEPPRALPRPPTGRDPGERTTPRASRPPARC